ncbi:MAG TPA: SRPBCC family protein [Streptosporangiaceae bacterium]
MHAFRCEAVITGDPGAVWRVWTDVARWPEWDDSKELARLDGSFAVGTTGWAKQRGNLGGPFTITRLDPGCGWTTEAPLPLGKVVFDHRVEPAGSGQVRVVKTVEVHGGFTTLFRLIVAAKMRRDINRSFAGLERHVKEIYG